MKEKADQFSAGQSLTKYSIYNTAHILGRSWNLGTNVTNVQNFWGGGSLLHSICKPKKNLCTVNPKEPIRENSSSKAAGTKRMLSPEKNK